MSKFVQFLAKGVIYDRDKKGRPCDVKEYRRGGASRSVTLI